MQSPLVVEVMINYASNATKYKNFIPKQLNFNKSNSKRTKKKKEQKLNG
jgi:hypothetical protein